MPAHGDRLGPPENPASFYETLPTMGNSTDQGEIPEVVSAR
jgi:hypothetical protein